MTTTNVARNSSRAAHRYRRLLSSLPREEQVSTPADHLFLQSEMDLDAARALATLNDLDLQLVSLVMNQLQPDEALSRALRAELVSRVQKVSPARKRKRVRLWLGAGTLAGLGLLGGMGAAAAGYFVMPGSRNVTPLSSPVIGTYEGTATIELGEPPEGTTGIEMELTCLAPGFLKIGEAGGGVDCGSADLRSGPYTTRGINALMPGQDSLTISTGSITRWQISVK